jgi:cell division cycle 14
MEVDKIINNVDYKTHKIYHYTSTDYDKKANAAYLMCAYLVVCQGKTAEEAWSFFEKFEKYFVPFRDAICAECTYKCTVRIINYFRYMIV